MIIVLQKTKSFLLIIGLVAVYFLLFSNSVSAQVDLEDAELKDYAWSSNIGWISMNCLNRGSCGTSDYQVKVDASDRLVGYAWSSNIGWIRFGGLSGFPTTGGNGGGNARLISGGSNLLMDGWARACTVFATGCSGSLKANNLRGGWDGWISLKGTTPDYRVELGGNYNTVNPASDDANQMAWGSTVIGWIDFNSPHSRVAIDINPVTDTFYGSDSDGNDDNIVSLGSNADLSWVIQGFDTCTASNDRGRSDWNGSVSASDSTTISPNTQVVTPPYGFTNYSLSCYESFRNLTINPTDVTIEARPNIEINSFSLRNQSSWSPQSGGAWDNVRFNYDVTGLPNGESTNYRLTYTNITHSGVDQVITGTVTGNSSGGANFSPALRLDNYHFGTSTIVLQIDLDASGNGPGSIVENIPGSGIGEDNASETGGKNSFTLANIFTAPMDPTIFSVTTPDDLIRYEETTTVEWDIETPYVLNCSVNGPGVSDTFNTNTPPAVPLPELYEDDMATPQLTSSGTYTLVCVEPLTGVTFSTTQSIEIIPQFQEI